MSDIIEPKVLKGFRDFLPSDEIERRELTGRIERVYRSYGYVPIDTPALEYTEILLGKSDGETEKQVYRFQDAGGRDVALRFDLTVPLARFTALHKERLPAPFKRYQIAKVWRGENTQRGRYREFTQCDCDALGEDSAAADFEILCMMRDALRAAGADKIAIQVNHRGLFNRFLERLGLREQSVDILRAVDKVRKTSRDETRSGLALIAGERNAEEILGYIESRGSWEQTLARLTALAGGPCEEAGRLEKVYRFLREMGIEKSFTLDPSITRGLDYYTGIVYESFLTDMPEIGSVCSGGRYDNLAGLYTKEKIAGVGASIGLDRLIAAFSASGKALNRATYAEAAIAACSEDDYGFCQKLAGMARNAGVSCEVLGADRKKLTAFFINAERRGLRYAIVADGEAGRALGGTFTLRSLAARQNTGPLTIDEIIQRIKDERP